MNRMMKCILLFWIGIFSWSCGSNSKPVESINVPITNTSPIIRDSIFYSYSETDIDSIWRRSDFDSAVAIILDGSRDIMYDVSKMHTKYSASSKRKLNALQFKNLLQNLSGKQSSTYTPADCFQPYHGFFFYKKGKIKASLAICFSCGTYFSKPAKSGGIDYELTKGIFKEVGLPVYNWDDHIEEQNSKIKYSDFFSYN